MREAYQQRKSRVGERKKVSMNSPTKTQMNTSVPTDSVGPRKLRKFFQLSKTQSPRRDNTVASGSTDPKCKGNELLRTQFLRDREAKSDSRKSPGLIRIAMPGG